MATAESVAFEFTWWCLQYNPTLRTVSIWHFHFPQLRVDVANPLVIHEQRIPHSLLVMGYTFLHCECSDLRYLIDIGSCATPHLLAGVALTQFLAFLLLHLWAYDRFNCLKWDSGRQPGAFKRVMTYVYSAAFWPWGSRWPAWCIHIGSCVTS